MAVSEGDKAPPFKLPADNGKPLAATAFKGHPLVLYFYPKDDTTGCTREGQDFRDAYAEFRAAGAAVVGVSRDDVASHAKFKAKYDFPFPLLADVEGTLSNAYGVWVEKSMYGRKYMGIERATFLIDGNGAVRNAWRKVKVEGHVAQVLAAVRAL